MDVVAGAPPAAAAQYIQLNEQQTLVFVEAENFTTFTTAAAASSSSSSSSSSASASAASGWQPRAWAHSPNYFASTVANVFHSRRAYLHHPALAAATSAAQATAAGDVAAAAFVVPAAGPHELLVRYEAPFRFEVPFEVTVVQRGAAVFRATYGRRATPKVWGFQSGRAQGEYSGCGAGLNPECPWPWGSTENMVWETHTAHSLRAGPAEIRLAAVRDTEYCCWADINVDAVLLHPNATAVNESIFDPSVRCGVPEMQHGTPACAGWLELVSLNWVLDRAGTCRSTGFSRSAAWSSAGSRTRTRAAGASPSASR